MSNNQWSLLKKNYFAPLFFTQFLGAFNDNLFKNALIILLAFNTAILPKGINDIIAVNISAGLFILPFFLFSGIAGQISDKYEKSKLIKILKLWEIIIVSVGMLGLYLENLTLLWVTLFGLGVQSAFFGPLKYSILPQHLNNKELLGGNALVESGTFIAILFGTILGGILIQLNYGWLFVGIISILIAILGYISAKNIPLAQANDPSIQINKNIITQTFKSLKIAKANKSVFLSILGISWFWFLGATLLAQFPSIIKNNISGDESIVTFFLAVFSIGIGLGSLLCDKLSEHKIEIGLVPFGAIGLSIFCLDFYYSLNSFSIIYPYANVAQFINTPGAIKIICDLIGISIFGGFFMVPLYALIQSRSKEAVRSQIIAANNILNAFFILSAVKPRSSERGCKDDKPSA